MYYVKYGEKYLHDPENDTLLISATLDTELNRSDIFTFTISSGHELYNSIKERDRNNLVIVYFNDTIIFRGEITTINDDFYLTKTVECRSELSYLNDTIVKPYSTFSGDGIRTVSSTIIGYFEFLINEHNSQVDPSKRFNIEYQLSDIFNYSDTIYRADTTFPTVGDTIKEKILDSLGLYLDIKYNNDGTRTVILIDSFANKDHINAQVIDFGVNLLDYVKDEESISVASYVIPIGNDIDEPIYDNESFDKLKTKLNIDISICNKLNEYYQYSRDIENNLKEEYDKLVEDGASEDEIKYAYEKWQEAITETEYAKKVYDDSVINTVNTEIEPGYHKLNYMVYSVEAVNKYGWIGKTVEHDDINYVSNLIKRGLEDIKKYENSYTTIEIKAIDLSIINSEYKTIQKGQYIRARSKPHNFDAYMLCSKINYDIIKPDNNVFTLGDVRQTFTQHTGSSVNALRNEIVINNDNIKTNTTDIDGLKILIEELFNKKQDGDAEIMIEINYADLKTLRNSNSLKPGALYKIIDYDTYTGQLFTDSAFNHFDIIVRADSTNELNENATASHSIRDTNGYFANSKLEAWKLKYTIDNDRNRFLWADISNGKGVIYELIDEFNNRCGYDFKNIRFLRGDDSISSGIHAFYPLKTLYDVVSSPWSTTPRKDTTIYAYTFTYISNLLYDIKDLTLENQISLKGLIHDNIIKSYYTVMAEGFKTYILNNIVFEVLYINLNSNLRIERNCLLGTNMSINVRSYNIFNNITISDSLRSYTDSYAYIDGACSHNDILGDPHTASGVSVKLQLINCSFNILKSVDGIIYIANNSNHNRCERISSINISTNSSNNVIRNSSAVNIGSTCENNLIYNTQGCTIDSNSSNNTIRNSSSIRIGTQCHNNEFYRASTVQMSGNCKQNILHGTTSSYIMSGCENNNIENSTSITINPNSSSNIIKQSCNNITINNNSSFNTIDQYSHQIVLGKNCNGNIFNQSCNYIYIADNSSYNHFHPRVYFHNTTSETIFNYNCKNISLGFNRYIGFTNNRISKSTPKGIAEYKPNFKFYNTSTKSINVYITATFYVSDKDAAGTNVIHEVPMDPINIVIDAGSIQIVNQYIIQYTSPISTNIPENNHIEYSVSWTEEDGTGYSIIDDRAPVDTWIYNDY